MFFMAGGCLHASEPALVTLDIPVLVAGYGSAFFEETAREFEALRPGMKVRIHGRRCARRD